MVRYTYVYVISNAVTKKTTNQDPSSFNSFDSLSYILYLLITNFSNRKYVFMKYSLMSSTANEQRCVLKIKSEKNIICVITDGWDVL